MDKKINLGEILQKHSNICFDDYDGVLDAMEDFGKQLLLLAAENAELNISHGAESGYLSLNDVFIDKDSILDTIKQIV